MNDNPTGWIIASIVISGAILTVRGLAKADITPRTYIALGVVAFFLLAIAQFSPELAAAFALLVLVVVLLTSAQDINEVLAFLQPPKGR